MITPETAVLIAGAIGVRELLGAVLTKRMAAPDVEKERLHKEIALSHEERDRYKTVAEESEKKTDEWQESSTTLKGVAQKQSLELFLYRDRDKKAADKLALAMTLMDGCPAAKTVIDEVVQSLNQVIEIPPLQ